MAINIEDIRKEDLFKSWEGTSIFSYVIANNGVDADIKLWIQARIYAARIAQSFYNEVVEEKTIYRPAIDFIRICGEIESDKEHDRWWKMTLRGVLFTMVSTFGFNDYLVRSDDKELIMDETGFNMMIDCIDPDFSQFTSDNSIYCYVKSILYEITRDYLIEGFYRYNVFDNNLLKENDTKVEEKKQKNIRASFEILNKSDDLNDRLQLFLNQLKDNGYIDKITDQQSFIDMFKGVAPAHKIVWDRKIYELNYLISNLKKKKIIEKKPKSVGLWAAVCSCFYIRKANKNKSNEPAYPETLYPKQFNNGGKVPNTHEELDKIIALLDPKLNLLEAMEWLNSSKDEINKMFDELVVNDTRKPSR